MNAPLETVERFPHTASDARKVTNAMLLEIDWVVGNMSLALHSRGMDERTVWIFHVSLPCLAEARCTDSVVLCVYTRRTMALRGATAAIGPTVAISSAFGEHIFSLDEPISARSPAA